MQPTPSLVINAAHQPDKRTTVFWRLAAVGLLFVFGAAASAAAGVVDLETAAVKAIPASVSTVVGGGLWGERGSYRVVVTQGGFEHIHSKVYAQWLSTDGKGESRIEKSVQVKQLSNLVPSVIGEIRFVFPSKESKGVFEVDVVNRESQKSAIALLRMGKPGELSVEMPPAELVE